jgi:hypothetical protein
MASHAIAAEPRHGLSVGSIFARSFNIMKADPMATLGLTFALISVPQLVSEQFFNPMAWQRGADMGTYVLVGAYGLVIGVLWLIASGALVHAAIAHDEGRRADLREILLLGARRALPLFAVELLFMIGIWIGFALLVIPGIIFSVMWSVCLPAVVAERTGVIGAFARSRALTKGARWRILGIGLLAFVIYFLVAAVVGVASLAGTGTLGALTGSVTVPAAQNPSFLLQLVQAIFTTAVTTWVMLVGAALFIELRHWKDGPAVDRLTEIFA